ncbi:MAG: response regulator [Burkholderiales bacterium]|nr:response regulator [Burkholderiales bacterium]
MRFRRSIALPLIGLLVLVSSGGAVISYFVNVRALESSLQETERDKLNHIGYIVETAIRAEAPRLSALARSLKNHAELKQQLVLNDRSEDTAGFRPILDRIYLDTRVDLLSVSGREQHIVYRAHDPSRYGDRVLLPGLARALVGEDVIVATPAATGVTVRAISPVALEGRIVGAIIVGTQLNDAYARRLARQVKAEVSFASGAGVWASSRPAQGLDAEARSDIKSSMARKQSSFQADDKAHKARLFVPLAVAEEPLVVVIETDTLRLTDLMEQARDHQIAISALLLGIAILLGTLLTLRIVRPLTQLKRRAVALAAGVTGQSIDRAEGSEIDSLVAVIDRTTAALQAANEKVLKRERETRLVTDSLPLAVAYVTSDLRYGYVNRRFADWCQRPVEQVVGRPVPEVIGAALYESVRAEIEAALGGQAVSYERQHMTGESRAVCYHSRLVPHHGDGGAVLGYYALIEDITERKAAESQAERARVFTGAIIDAVPSPVFVKDEQHKYIALNDAMCELIGKPREELLGRTDYDVFPEHEADVFRARDQEVIDSGIANDNEESITDAAGVAHWILTRKRGYALPGGQRILVGVITDLTERRRVEMALRESEAQANRLALVASRTQNAVIITDARGRIEWVNEGFTRLTGYELGEVTGRVPGRMLQNEETDPQTVAHIAACMGRGEPFQVEIVNQSKDGRRYWLAIDAQPICDRSGNLTNFIAIESDISERKKVEEELRQAKIVAEAASRAKSEFVANMSHEIRTPMNGVLGMTELLLDSDLSERQRRFAQTIRNSGEALLNIINDILDFSKIEAGRMELDCSPFDVRAVVEETAELLAARAHSKGVELACNIASDVPVGVEGDAGRLRQVLTNLIGNAVKFTESGEVVVAVKRIDDPAGSSDSCTLELSVTDTGIGMSEEARARLFQPFSQADGTTTRRYGGTGLGLAISRQLVELMGGEIALESEPGKGSRFWFRLALRISAALPEDLAVSESLRGLRVLIVEDNPTNAAILQHYTQAWGMKPICVDRAEKALAHLQTAGVDLALIDWKLPGMSGPELARHLREKLLPAQPLVLLTSMTANDVAGTARGAGFNAYLSKPVRRDELLRCLARVLGETEERCHDGVALTQRFDARVLLVEDNAVNAEICTAMLASLGCSVDTAANGVEAVEMSAEHRYDLVLMDCQMPVMDGFEATRTIRSREQVSPMAHRVPIIALTANAMQGDRDRCLTVGMDDYLAKPFKRQQLEAVLAQYAHAGEAARSAATTPARASAPGQGLRLAYVRPAAPTRRVAPAGAPAREGGGGSAEAVLDRAALAAIRALERPGSGDLLRRVLDRYAEDAPRLVASMRAAAANDDAHALQIAAHTLKSASANVGAMALAEMCKNLESTGRSGATTGAAEALLELDRELECVGCALRAELVEQAAS